MTKENLCFWIFIANGHTTIKSYDLCFVGFIESLGLGIKFKITVTFTYISPMRETNLKIRFLRINEYNFYAYFF